MRIQTVFTAAAAASAILLAACSGGSQGTSSMVPGSGTQAQSHLYGHSYANLARTGIAAKFFPLLRFGHAPKGTGGPRHLWVSDGGASDVAIYDNHTFTETGTITYSDGIGSVDGVFFDKSGNFYVAEYANSAILEYNHHSLTAPSFTYSTGMTNPVNVAVDKAGNVYEADYGGAFVNEYAQGSNTVSATCSPGGDVEGVAIDKSGDVFVDFLNPSTLAGEIVEYTGGLSGCSGTLLGVSNTIGFVGGMAIDKMGNLVVCDQTNAVVDIIAPPYTSVTGTLGSGYGSPFHVTISRTNKLAYVGDDVSAVVDVLDYPSGTLVQQLGSANGLVDPYAAVDGSNAVY